jgi:hypothetical protein
MDDVFLMLVFPSSRRRSFPQREYDINIALPTAQTGKVPDRLPGEIFINIARTAGFV